MHWLALELGEVVRADKLFDTFRRDILHREASPSMADLVPRLCRDAQIMRSFDDFDPATSEGLFFSRLETMDTTTMLPVALFLFRTEELSSERRSRALGALESWLVRRAILRLMSAQRMSPPPSAVGFASIVSQETRSLSTASLTSQPPATAPRLSPPAPAKRSMTGTRVVTGP
jgi:hypothetical protein